jgi:hypothetical protein
MSFELTSSLRSLLVYLPLTLSLSLRVRELSLKKASYRDTKSPLSQGEMLRGGVTSM